MIEYLSFVCNEFDKLEALAINKTAITLLPNPYIILEPIFMTDILAKDGMEHIYFSNSEKIRLNRIDIIEENIIFLKFSGEEE